MAPIPNLAGGSGSSAESKIPSLEEVDGRVVFEEKLGSALLRKPFSFV